jgi:tetratricopeptide (TPR) repeat protein
MKLRRVFLVGAACLGISASVLAQEEVLESIRSESESWLAAQVRRFRSYPHLDRAYRLMRAGSLEEARKELEIYLDISPSDTHARFALVDLLYRMEDYEGTIREAGHLLERAPGYTPAFLYRGLSRLSLGQIELAIRDYRAAAELTHASLADRSFAVSSLVELAYERGQYADALEGLELMPAGGRDSRFFFRKGLCLEALGRLEEAESAFDQSLDLTTELPRRLECYRSLGEVAKKRQDWVGAERAFAEALRLSPEDVDSMRSLAWLALRRGDVAEARDWTKQVLEARPNREDREFLVHLHVSLREYEDAVSELSMLLGEVATNADRHRVMTTLGYIQAERGKLVEAVSAFQTALQYRKVPATYLALAGVLEQQGLMTDAIAVLEKALDVAPSSIVHQRLAVLHADAGEQDKALDHLEAAVELGLPDDMKQATLQQQGHIYYSLGLYAESRDALEGALALKPEDPQLKRSLALAYVETGALDEAEAIFLELIEEPFRSTPGAQEILTELGHLEMKRGRHLEAAEYFSEAFELLEEPRVEILSHWATALSAAEDWEGAIRIYHRRMALGGLTPESRAEIMEQLGRAHFALGDVAGDEEAAFYLKTAIASGRDERDIRQTLGLVLYRQGKWDQALDEFLVVLDAERTPQSLIYVARCLQELNRPGLAIHYLDEAVAELERFSREEQITLLNELGFLYAEESEYRAARRSWSRSLELRYDASLALRVGRMNRLLGDVEEARAVLERVEPDVLPDSEEAERLDELAAVYEAEGEQETALESAELANAVCAAPRRYYRLGLLYQTEGHQEEALAAFRGAVAADPDEPRYAEAYGFALSAGGRTEEAIVQLESVVERDPDYLQVYEQLGYLNMKRADNKTAESWFERAIDNETFYPVHSEEDQKQLERDVFRFRREVTKITNYFDVDLYTSLRSDSGAPSPGVIGSAVLPSQGGASFSYQPHGWGFRNERIFQAFLRVLWNHEPESIRWDTDSFQGGLGVRYKPLASQNLYGSFEKLFKIGDDALSNWLLRGLYSWDYGYELRPGETSWNYTLAYGEVGYLLQEPKTLAFYGEGREGWTFNVSESLLLTPHGVLAARHQDPANAISNYVEGGLGVSLKVLFNESRYKAHHSSFEVLLQYRWGRYLGEMRPEVAGFSGLVIGGSIHF